MCLPPPDQPLSANEHLGFTLVELLVVLAIASLLVASGLAIFKAPSSDTTRVRAAARELASELRQKRVEAILSASVRTVEFSPTGYRSANAVRTLPHGASLSLPDGTGERASPSLVFRPDGSSSGIALRLTLGQTSREITVSSLTGGVFERP